MAKYVLFITVLALTAVLQPTSAMDGIKPEPHDWSKTTNTIVTGRTARVKNAGERNNGGLRNDKAFQMRLGGELMNPVRNRLDGQHFRLDENSARWGGELLAAVPPIKAARRKIRQRKADSSDSSPEQPTQVSLPSWYP